MTSTSLNRISERRLRAEAGKHSRTFCNVHHLSASHHSNPVEESTIVVPTFAQKNGKNGAPSDFFREKKQVPHRCFVPVRNDIVNTIFAQSSQPEARSSCQRKMKHETRT
jgi:hypothetical protein